jgi:hypothetical protein
MLVVSLSALLMCVVSAGCMQKMTVEEMKEHMPTRPAELDRLNAFVGKWQDEGEIHCSFLVEDTVKTTGTNEYAWEGDGWYLVNLGTFTMPGVSDMKAMGTWTYDTHAKVYRSTWVDSMGTVGTGTGKYHADQNKWTMKFKSYGPHGKTCGKSMVKLIDDDTMKWEWCEYTWGGLVKVMEMTGTSHRQR